METNFNLGSLKIVQAPLTEYLKEIIINIEENIIVIRDEKKISTNHNYIEINKKVVKTLRMIGLNGLSKVLETNQEALEAIKVLSFDSKKNIEILEISKNIIKNSLGYIQRLIVSGLDQPTQLYKDYKELSKILGKETNIKDLFFPKLDLIESINEQLKNDLRVGILINENTSKNLILHLEKVHANIQNKLLSVFKVLGNNGEFPGVEDRNTYQNVCKELYNSFDYAQKLKINKNYYVIFGLYKLYVCVLSPVFNSNFNSYVETKKNNIKINISKFDKVLSKLIQNIKELETGDKTGNLKIDEENAKEIVFELVTVVKENRALKEMPVYKDLISFFDFEYYIEQLDINKETLQNVHDQDKINEIETIFYDYKEDFNLLNNKEEITDDFNKQVIKLITLTQKLIPLINSNKELNSIIKIIEETLNVLKNKKISFSDILKREISLSLVLIDYGIKNFIKNNIDEALKKDYKEQIEIQSMRLKATIENDLNKLNAMEFPKLDKISQKEDAKNTFVKIFEELREDLNRVEESIDTYLRSEGEIIEELQNISKPLINIKGILSIIGKPELTKVVQLIGEPWKKVTKEKNEITEDEIKNSVSLISGLSILVKSYINKNEEEAEEIYDNLMSLFYKINLNGFDKIEPVTEDEKEYSIGELPIETIFQEVKEESLTNSEVVSGDYTEEANDPEIAEIFFAEADDVFENLNKSINSLENNLVNQEEIKNLRRFFHTLKGSSRMVGLEFFGEMSWMTEQTLDKVLSNELEMSSNLLNLTKEIKEKSVYFVNELKDNKKINVDLKSLKAKFLDINPNITNNVEIDLLELPKEKVAELTLETESLELPKEEIAELISETELLELPKEEVSELISETESLELPKEEIAELTLETESLELELPNEDEENLIINNVKIPKEIYNLFNEESVTHIEKMIIYAHENYDGLVNLNDKFMRHAHTLSSISASVNLMKLSAISSRLEAIALTGIERNISFTQEQMNIIRQAVDNLDLFKNLNDKESESIYEPIILGLNNLRNNLNKLEKESEKNKDVIVDTEKITQDILNVLTKVMEEQNLRFISELKQKDDENQKINEQLIYKIEELENQLREMSQQNELKEKTINKALEASKNDIRTMANILKKKSELTFDNVHQESFGEITEEINSELDLIENESNSFISEIVQDNKVLDSSIFKNEFIQAIFDEKVSVAEDEIDIEIYELSKPEAEEMLELITNLIEEIDENGLKLDRLQSLKRYLHTFKGSVRMAGANKLGMLAHRLESLLEHIEIKKINIFEFKVILDKELNKINSLIKNPQQKFNKSQLLWLDDVLGNQIIENNEKTVSEEKIETIKKESKQFIRVQSNVIDSVLNDAGEIRLTRTALQDTTENAKKNISELQQSSSKLLGMVKEIEIQAESKIQSTKDNLTDSEFDPLEFDRFTRLQELTRLMNEVVADISDTVTNLDLSTKSQDVTISHQTVMTNNLLSELMKVRLVHVDSITDRFYKIARNTAKELNKKVTLEITGEKTEVDKLVLDKVISPIEHILRNSIAHGIEFPDVRSKKDKPLSGKIKLSFSVDGNFIIIKISDDGAGINIEKIREMGIQKGLLIKDKEHNNDDIINLIFNSGFSTADSISQVSGRGIGMDVVKSEITSLGGNIKTETEKNKGTIFTLTLPMEVSTTHAMLCNVKEKLIAIPASLINEVASIKDKDIKNSYLKGEITIKGKNYPLYYMGHLLGLLNANVNPEIKTYNSIVIIKYIDNLIAIHVDKLITTNEILIKSLGIIFGKISGILGGTILGNGKQGVVVNPIMLAEHYNKNLKDKLIENNVVVYDEKDEISTRTTVLVVDDSITVRRASTKVLERNNYNVVVAKDGEDALEQIQIITPDIILSDIEMPKMDGFEFLKNLRSVDKYKKIPVIMITSRTAEKHQKYAFEIGANDFLGKPYKEDELILKMKNLLDNKI